MANNVREMDIQEVWEGFWWLMWLSHFELVIEDMDAMDSIEGRK